MTNDLRPLNDAELNAVSGGWSAAYLAGQLTAIVIAGAETVVAGAKAIVKAA